MKDRIWVIDNYFRNPFRLGKVSIYKQDPYIAFGYKYTKRLHPHYIKPQWIFVIYFYKWYKAWSNYPLNNN